MIGSIITPLFAFSFLRLYTFSYSPGGIYDVTADILFDPPTSAGGAWVLICSDDQTSSLLNSDDSQTLCRRNISQVCFASAYFPSSGNTSLWNVKQVVDSELDVNLLALSCSEGASTLSLQWHLYNVNGELSAGDYPRLALTNIFTYLYGGLIFFLVLQQFVIKVYFFQTRQVRVARPVNFAIVFVLVVCMGACVASRAYWQDLSQTGIDALFGALSISSILMSAFARVSIVVLVLALSKGWQTLREHLQLMDIRQIAILSLFLLLTLSFISTLGGLFSLFLVSLLYLVIMRLQFASMTFSINVLTTMANEGYTDEGDDENDNTSTKRQHEEQLLNQQEQENLPSLFYGGVFEDQEKKVTSVDTSLIKPNVKLESLVTRQLVLFRTLRAVSSIYFLVTLFFEVFWDLLGEDYPWVGQCVNQITMFIFLCYIAWAFRFRNEDESPLYDLNGYKSFDKWEHIDSSSESSFLLVSEDTNRPGTIAIAEPMRER